MRWEDLDRHVPWVGGEGGRPLHSSATIIPRRNDWSVVVQQPGVHAADTQPQGGDFLVRVSSARSLTAAGVIWSSHPFSHEDLFPGAELKSLDDRRFMTHMFAPALATVIADGSDPDVAAPEPPHDTMPGLEVAAALVAAQCLALAEHRRYRRFGPRGGRGPP